MKQKLSNWAKEHQMTYQGAWFAFERGDIPGAYRLPSGSIYVETKEIENKSLKTIIYGRVSNAEQKNNLESQITRLNQFSSANGWVIDEIIKDIGSGLNDKRKGLSKILSYNCPIRLIVEHKDRLTRFGFEYINQHITGNEGAIIVINNPIDEKEDIMQDFISIITSFCAKIYGQRRTKRKTEKLIEKLQNETEKE